MANMKYDPLFELIKSLTKSEKRHFRMFVNRGGSSEDVKFVMLFDAMDGAKSYDDKLILAKVTSIKKIQLSNQKANLYKQILASLRHFHIGHNVDIQLREILDHSKVLYNKGFYKQALKLLERGKLQAKDAKYYTMVLEFLEFEKLIESQYITRSIETRAEELTKEVNETTVIVTSSHSLSNLTLSLYSLFLQNGYAKNERDFNEATAFFKSRLPDLKLENLSFHEQLYYHQSHVWYNNIVQNFPNSYRHALAWIELFKANPDMIAKQLSLYIKGYWHLLGSLFQLQYYSKFCVVLTEIEALAKNDDIVKDLNTEVLIFKFLWISKINKHFMEGSFEAGVELIPKLLKKLKEYEGKIDPERVLMFYYKIASLYFGNGDFRKAIFYLNQIIYFKDISLREDIHCFARILNLIAHFEDGQDFHLEYQIKSTFHFIGKMNDQQAVQKEIFQFLRRTGKIKPDDLKQEFQDLHMRLSVLNEDLFERRPFLYFDILSWLQSKIENRPVKDIVKEKFKTLR
ncbi:MAG: tetratricopeptide (TPR) repeat protein [Roseivirga sp.]|jgi:tetratricopeptide (TPR) repeat protein